MRHKHQVGVGVGGLPAEGSSALWVEQGSPRDRVLGQRDHGQLQRTVGPKARELTRLLPSPSRPW